jgi:hypothetical protein
LQAFNSSILACKIAFSFLRLEIETLQTFKSLALEINLSFSVLRLAIDSFNLSIVGDLFSNAMSQEQGNIENVNRYSPSSFEALFSLGYNDFRTKVMKAVPS